MEELIPYDKMRPVEWLAVFFIIYGYIPSSAFSRSYASPNEVYRKKAQGSQVVTRFTSQDGRVLRDDTPGWMLRAKYCVQCGELWPDTERYYYKDESSKNGLRNVCVFCCRENATANNWRKRGKPHRCDAPRTMSRQEAVYQIDGLLLNEDG